MTEKTLNQLIVEVHEINEVNGWNENRTIGEDLALIHSEVSEALEAYRESGDVLLRWYTHTYESQFGTVKNISEEQVNWLSTSVGANRSHASPKPEGVGAELADALIRILHTADMHGIDLAAEVGEKLSHNRTRGYKHGGKFL